MHFHVNAAEAELDALLGGARAYLHPKPESFGIAVVEAIAAGAFPSFRTARRTPRPCRSGVAVPRRWRGL